MAGFFCLNMFVAFFFIIENGSSLMVSPEQNGEEQEDDTFSLTDVTNSASIVKTAKHIASGYALKLISSVPEKSSPVHSYQGILKTEM